MKRAILVLSALISFIWFGLAFGACQQVMTVDFQGQVCTEASGGNSLERREGEWLNEDGGVFTGTARISKSYNGQYELSKEGVLEGMVFQGRLVYNEAKRGTRINSEERREGKENLPEGGTFEGTKMQVRRDNSLQLRKEGMLRTANFHGRLVYDEVKEGDKIRSEERIEGKEGLPEGGIFEGVRFTRRDGDEREVRKEGVITAQSFQGRLTYREFKNGNNVRSSEERYGKENLPGGGTFAGKKVLTRYDNGLSLVKDGTLTTAVFQGRVMYWETKEANRITSEERLEGVWRVTPQIILRGNMITQCDANGRVVVKDYRKQLK